jgi:hypothetical protein
MLVDVEDALIRVETHDLDEVLGLSGSGHCPLIAATSGDGKPRRLRGYGRVPNRSP